MVMLLCVAIMAVGGSAPAWQSVMAPTVRTVATDAIDSQIKTAGL